MEITHPSRWWHCQSYNILQYVLGGWNRLRNMIIFLTFCQGHSCVKSSINRYILMTSKIILLTWELESRRVLTSSIIKLCVAPNHQSPWIQDVLQCVNNTNISGPITSISNKSAILAECDLMHWRYSSLLISGKRSDVTQWKHGDVTPLPHTSFCETQWRHSVKTRLYKNPPPYFIVLANSVKTKEFEVIEFHRLSSPLSRLHAWHARMAKAEASLYKGVDLAGQEGLYSTLVLFCAIVNVIFFLDNHLYFSHYK